MNAEKSIEEQRIAINKYIKSGRGIKMWKQGFKEGKKLTIFDSDMRWLKQILECSILNGSAILDNIKLEYNGIGKWNHLRFDYKDIDLRTKNK